MDISTHPLRSDRAALEYLKMMQEDWLYGLKHFDSPIDRALMRLVLIGWMERKPYDLSVMALDLGTSRQQVKRRVDSLTKRGLLVHRRERARVLLYPTECLVTKTQELMEDRLVKRAACWARIAKLLAHPLRWMERDRRIVLEV